MAGFNLVTKIVDALGNAFSPTNRLPVQTQHDQPLTDSQLRASSLATANQSSKPTEKIIPLSLSYAGVVTTGPLLEWYNFSRLVIAHSSSTNGAGNGVPSGDTNTWHIEESVDATTWKTVPIYDFDGVQLSGTETPVVNALTTYLYTRPRGRGRYFRIVIANTNSSIRNHFIIYLS